MFDYFFAINLYQCNIENKYKGGKKYKFFRRLQSFDLTLISLFQIEFVVGTKKSSGADSECIGIVATVIDLVLVKKYSRTSGITPRHVATASSAVV